MLKKRPIEFDISDEHQDGDEIFNEVFEMSSWYKKFSEVNSAPVFPKK